MDRSAREQIRAARTRRGWAQAELAHRMHVSRSTVSRWESGAQPITDVHLLRRLARVLEIEPETLGVTCSALAEHKPDAMGDDPVRRRRLLSHLAVTAAASAVMGVPETSKAWAGAPNAGPGGAPGGDLLAAMRDMLLGTGPPPALVPEHPDQVRAGLARTRKAFHECRYRDMATLLPRVVAGAQRLATEDDTAACAVLAHAYILAARLLIKIDGVELGVLCCDRAHVVASGTGDRVLMAEASRNLSVLTRKAGWHDQAAEIALCAADRLQAPDPRTQAQRGLLLMSAAYTAAKAQDAGALVELTGQADRIAAGLGDKLVLPAHGGQFGAPMVALHLISGHNAVGAPDAALKVAAQVTAGALPTIERQARYWADVATAYGMRGQREGCVESLLQAERLAPQEVRARPAVQTLVQGMLSCGRLSPQLRGLAARMNLT